MNHIQERRRRADDAYASALRAWRTLWYEISRSGALPLQGIYRQLYTDTIEYATNRFEGCISSVAIENIVKFQLDRAVAMLHLRHLFTVQNDFDSVLLLCEDEILEGYGTARSAESGRQSASGDYDMEGSSSH